MKKLRLLISAVFFTFALAGCASSVYEGRYAWGDGWREGEITAVEAVGEVKKECMGAVSSSAEQRFVTIRYIRMGRNAWRTVPIPAEAPWKIGDLLYINVVDCKVGLQSRAM